MRRFIRVCDNLLSEESGQDLVEYVLVVALIALASIAIMQNFAATLATALVGMGSRLTNAV